MTELFTQERRNEIARQLMAEGKVSAQALARQYCVSTETIRKDLLWLEAQGIARKSYGGATAAVPQVERSFFEKASCRPQEKRRIAKAAADEIPDGSIVILDSGSSVLEVARKLALRRDITFFTNSLQTAQLLIEKKCNITMLGGSIRLSSQAATGMWTIDQLSQLRADWAILGASGFEGSDGPCVESMEEAQVKKAMIRAAKKRMLVADSSKSRCSATMRFACWNEIDMLVTDEDLDPDLNRSLENIPTLKIITGGRA